MNKTNLVSMYNRIHYRVGRYISISVSDHDIGRLVDVVDNCLHGYSNFVKFIRNVDLHHSCSSPKKLRFSNIINFATPLKYI